MSSKDRRRGAARRPSFHVEALEGRALMSVVPILLTLRRGPSHGNAAALLSAPTGAGTSGGAAPAATTPMGQPTPHEIARERFVAKFSGTYVTGPGRFTDQSLQSFFLATGGSNQARHLNLQLRFFVPTDPALPTTGIVALSDKNAASSGNTLVLDLTAAPQPGFHGLPTQFTWTVDPASGGVWQNSAGFGTGQGTLAIHYTPGGKLPQRANGAGRASLVFQGMINTSQVSNILAAPGNRPKHS